MALIRHRSYEGYASAPKLKVNIPVIPRFSVTRRRSRRRDAEKDLIGVELNLHVIHN